MHSWFGVLLVRFCRFARSLPPRPEFINPAQCLKHAFLVRRVAHPVRSPRSLTTAPPSVHQFRAEFEACIPIGVAIRLHTSVWEKVTLSEGLQTIGFPERPEVGLHQSVWEKVTLSEGLRLRCQPGAPCNSN